MTVGPRPLIPGTGVLDRLRAAMAANPHAPEIPIEPETAPFPADGTCPDCGTRLCGWCARIYRLMRQHLKPDGTCPFGHRSEVSEKEERR